MNYPFLERLAGVNRDSTPSQPVDPLKSREEEVLERVATGKTNEEIADVAAWAWDTGRMQRRS